MEPDSDSEPGFQLHDDLGVRQRQLAHLNGKLTANLGLRWDKNRGEDQAGNVVANDSAFSPRVGVVFDPTGNGRWSITGSVAKYVSRH